MYIATHLGWVVLSCAVLMFFRKRSIQKKQPNKKLSQWNSSTSCSARGTKPLQPGPAGDASSVAERKGLYRAGGALSGGHHSVTSQALLMVYPDTKFHIIFLQLGVLGRPTAPAHAQHLDMEICAQEREGSPCTEPISTAPVG